MNEESYQKLADHLDQLPGGFAPSDTGAELRLLKRLFTPEEAELARYLTLDKEDARSIAHKSGVSLAETEHRLAKMARKGLIFSIHPEGGSPLYHAVPFIVGIYEFQVNNLSEDLIQTIEEYWSTRRPRPRVHTTPQMRTIPIEQSIETHLEALSYEQVNAMVTAHDKFAVAPCICRRHAKMTGGGCDAPDENCLMFGDWADYYVRGGRGRSIDRFEVMEILASADAANLVLQSTNSRDIAAICCCCGCCCGVLRGLKRYPHPSEIVASSFIATLEPEQCQGCGVCLERCQMQALVEEDDRVTLNTDRCIGCGLCVTTCPSGALTLKRRVDRDPSTIPSTMNATWHTIVQAQNAARNEMP